MNAIFLKVRLPHCYPYSAASAGVTEVIPVCCASVVLRAGGAPAARGPVAVRRTSRTATPTTEPVQSCRAHRRDAVSKASHTSAFGREAAVFQ